MGTWLRDLGERSPLTVFLAALLTVALIGWLDFASGIYLSFSLIYLVPVGIVASVCGRDRAIVVAVVATLVGLIGDLSQDAAGFLPFWNAVMRLGVFAVVAVVLAKLRDAHERERLLARTDPLTGAANFRWFEEAARHELYVAHRYGGPLTLAYVDLDGFKAVNDASGHAVGDEVLKTFVATLVECLRPTDLVARVGGDEFVVLFPRTDETQARAALDRAREALGRAPGMRHVGFSAGIVELHDAVGSVDDLMGVADAKMYADKAERRRPVLASEHLFE
jgi:diguanylate cyclase (GGDEF)-like protein